MPRIGSKGVENAKLNNDHYGYSAIGLDKLGASEYTLVTIVCDKSGSVFDFKNDLEKCLKEVLGACKHSPRADNLMIRVVAFNNSVDEIHGFKLLSSISPDDYDNALSCGGETALFDASSNAVSATIDYGKKLSSQDFAVNAIVIVITDGDDNSSRNGINSVKAVLSKATKSESVESLISILVAVNAGECSALLDKFHKEAGFSQFVDIGEASKSKIAKLAAFVSKSISSQSNSLGSGNQSKLLTF